MLNDNNSPYNGASCYNLSINGKSRFLMFNDVDTS